jgi:membrane glycosyltransferase
MTIASLASDGSTLTLLCRVIALTLFYAALCWLPLRGTAAVVGVMHRLKRRRRRTRRRPEPQPQETDTTWVIR